MNGNRRWRMLRAPGPRRPECSGGIAPQGAAQARGAGDRPRDGSPDGLLVADEDQALLGPAHRGVEQLAGEEPRVRAREQEGDGVELRALALVHRHRVDGVDGGEPGGAHFGDALAALEGGGQPPAADVDDDPGVAVEELESVVVLGHDEWPTDVPVTACRESLHFGTEPRLDVMHPRADALGPPAVGAQEAETAERGDGVRGVAPSGCLNDGPPAVDCDG